jgi:hypothetical protein
MTDQGPSSADGPSDDQAEREIDAFIEQADHLGGPPVSELGNQVALVMQSAWESIDEQVGRVPNNKLIAVMLLLSREAREAPADEPQHWYLHAAATIVGGLIRA